ncbi:MAG: tetratricopeptide repeat-containing sensor histidine kinase [Bacteroidetes bacterium]|nr:tetratricopeptide repeat-containing sensor histidine kinase [Bacteroidota bacterium]
MRLFLVFCLTLSITFISAQTKSKKVLELGNRIDYYLSYSKPDSAYICLADFLNKPGLDTSELFYGHMYFGITYFQNKKFTEGFSEIRTSLGLVKNSSRYNIYTYKAYEVMSDQYFTLQRYDSARYYADQCRVMVLENKPVNFRLNLARCYNILGYCAFLEKDYTKAIDDFNKSVDNYKLAAFPCDISLVYCKLAKVYNRKGDKATAEKYIREALYMSDTCKSDDNRLVSKRSELEILKENHDYERALACLEEINRLVETIETNRQMNKMDELEVKYKTRLKNQENISLREKNAKNEALLSQQKLALFFVVAIIVMLSILVFFMFRVQNIRKKSLLEIEKQSQEIQLKNHELERLHVLNQKIFSVVSHDLRGPMLSLQLLLKTLRDETKDERLNHYTEDVNNQLLYATQIMDNLLNWARTEINMQVNENFTANPYVIADEIICQVEAIAQAKKVKIENRIPVTIEVQIPPDVLRIVFRNLVSNALKYSFENSVVEITYSLPEHTISVKDQGTGIPENKLGILFSRDIPTSLGTRHEAGFGLGLYITHELLHRFGGRIQASNNADKGAEFRVYLPPVENN